MKKLPLITFVILSTAILLALAACQEKTQPAATPFTAALTQPDPTQTQEETLPILISTEPSPTPEPTPFPSLYDCKMEIHFTSGPLADQSTRFTVLGEDYFSEKGEKFYPGKNTAVYYNYPQYLILHSAYDDGNLLKPLEAEFLRFYLERWGDLSNNEIADNIDSLIGSEAAWYCDDQLLFNTSVNDIVRLSHEASKQVWFDPRMIEKVLAETPGPSEDWIGDITLTDTPGLYLGFCGWGPVELGDARLEHYRYVFRFKVSD